MEFKADSSKQGSSSNQTALLVPEQVPESLVGRLCQVIEMLGLRDSQEKATKDTIKNIIYDTFGHNGSCEYIDSDLYKVIESVIYQKRNYSGEYGIPGSTSSYCLIETLTLPESKTAE